MKHIFAVSGWIWMETMTKNDKSFSFFTSKEGKKFIWSKCVVVDCLISGFIGCKNCAILKILKTQSVCLTTIESTESMVRHQTNNILLRKVFDLIHHPAYILLHKSFHINRKFSWIFSEFPGLVSAIKNDYESMKA